MTKEKIILINHHAKMTLPEWFSKAKQKDVESIVDERIIPYLKNQHQDYGFLNDGVKRKIFRTALVLSAKAFLNGNFEVIPDKDYNIGGIRNHDSICLGCDNHYNIDGKRGCRIIID